METWNLRGPSGSYITSDYSEVVKLKRQGYVIVRGSDPLNPTAKPSSNQPVSVPTPPPFTVQGS